MDDVISARKKIDFFFRDFANFFRNFEVEISIIIIDTEIFRNPIKYIKNQHENWSNRTVKISGMDNNSKLLAYLI